MNSESPDNQFCKVSLEDFVSEKSTDFNIYLRLSPTKYIRVIHKGGKISEDRMRVYKRRGISYVYVRKEDFPRLIGFNMLFANAVRASEQVSPEKKLHFMKYTGELILESVFVKGMDEESLSGASDFVEMSLEILTNEPATFELLEMLSQHTDSLYAHSLGVSVFAVMIAKEMGWESSITLFKLSYGGLFHDVGKKEISREILERPRHLLTQTERQLLESHPLRGRDILHGIQIAPAEVIAMACEHHEDPIGQGYPRRLTRHQIHPMAKVIHMADRFCNYTVKSDGIRPQLSAEAAVAKLEQVKGESVHPEPFAALKRLVQKSGPHQAL